MSAPPPDAAPDVRVEDLVRRERPSRARTGARARTESIRRLSKHELELGRRLNPDEPHFRPRTRGDCANVPRPCPFVSCKFHLYLDVHPRNGAIKLNFPDRDVDELRETCALDVAEHGGSTLDEVGRLVNLSRERVRQFESMVFRRLGIARVLERARGEGER